MMWFFPTINTVCVSPLAGCQMEVFKVMGKYAVTQLLCIMKSVFSQ